MEHVHYTEECITQINIKRGGKRRCAEILKTETRTLALDRALAELEAEVNTMACSSGSRANRKRLLETCRRDSIRGSHGFFLVRTPLLCYIP